MTIGACATSGGIQALRNWADVEEYTRLVYANPQYVESLETATPIAAHVFVDFELRGCPINKKQLLEVIAAYLMGRKPNVPTYSLCIQCKRRGIPCRLVSAGEPCLGPITQAGCGALCPSVNRPCYGCFGPMEMPNIASLGDWFAGLGYSAGDMVRMLRSFNGYLEPFKQASDRYEQIDRTV
jgi:coenzyme F420-reducing hydrogenase gamma subunit